MNLAIKKTLSSADNATTMSFIVVETIRRALTDSLPQG